MASIAPGIAVTASDTPTPHVTRMTPRAGTLARSRAASRLPAPPMPRHLLLLTLAASPAFAQDAARDAGTAGEPSFRVRADVAAALDADAGWAAGPGQSATVLADRPFRLRMELEPDAAGAPPRALALEMRRNDGAWTRVEAHDFPYPQRALELEYEDAPVGAAPAGWRVAAGTAARLAVADEDGGRALRLSAGDAEAIALHALPWPTDAASFAAELRLPARGEGPAGLVVGFVDARNHWRLVLDADAGAVQVSRFVDGVETVLDRRSAGLMPGAWDEIEVAVEDGQLLVGVGDDALAFALPVGDAVPMTDVGLVVAAGGTLHLRAAKLEAPPASPRASIIASAAFDDGDASADLLRGARTPFAGGAGASLSERVALPVWRTAGTHVEVEWPLVVRRFTDGALTNEDGDTFAFRAVDADTGAALRGPVATLTLDVPDGHLGGTFVETPGRIGPWQARNGDLYVVMEPAESDNKFMVVTSTDGGASWREVDGAHRPATGDLESVDGRLVGDTLHLIHQVSEATYHHAFRTADHPTRPDTWAITDEPVNTVVARTQMASLVARPDGSLVAFHLGDTLGYAIRAPDGRWGAETVIGGNDGTPRLAGPQAVLGARGETHLAYTREDGTAWHRRLLADGTLTAPQLLACGMDTGEEGFGAVLPLAYLPRTDTVVVVFQHADGTLWERRVRGDALPTPAAQVAPRAVVRSPVDSQQPGADVVADGDTVRVLYIDAQDRDVYATHNAGGWQPAERVVPGVDAAWVRGAMLRRADGARVHGFVYDAGSNGGAGFNRYTEVPLED